MALSGGDVRLILVGLVLNADDEGRELAHTKLLGRELDYESTVVEQALEELAANDLILLYSVGKHRYYSLQRWNDWETLSKPSPSKYPAPPQSSIPQPTQENTSFPEIPQENPGEIGETPSEGEGEEELEEKRREEEEEGKPSNVVTFPTVHTSDADDDAKSLHVTKQVASILKLPVNDALQRIVGEYSRMATLSLLGEADSAREWIDDRKRNPTGKHMTLAFFRRWLQREHETALKREMQRQSATGTDGRDTQEMPTSKPTSRLPSLMDLETTYHNAQQQGGKS